MIGNFQTAKSFNIPLFMTGHKNCVQADYFCWNRAFVL
jgi:hypothetical protein